MKRTLATDTVSHVGKKVRLLGWLHSRRDHGKIVFADLRDRSGLVQVVANKKMLSVRPESVVEIEGTVKKRPDNLVNPKLETGTIEIEATKVTTITEARELPFPIDTDGYDINEEIRNKYRYLDIRRPRMTRNLRVRSRVTQFIRHYLTEQDFVEVETPILTKTTPEGARDFIVPSRLQPGNFYALPQSPQQYKQLLMVAGLERYFQIAKCFRDEDPRADRAYGEFTQLDMEMSFVTQDDILSIIEDMYTKMVEALFPGKRIQKSPWPRISHTEAMKKYGSDRPDLRKDKNDPDELAFAWVIDFPLFAEQSDDDFYHGSGEAKFAPSHHMFTAPHPDDVKLLDKNPLKVRGQQHDMVLNGFEVGGGSVRIHDLNVQEKVFDLIGFSDEQKQQFEHMLTAFTYGVPPHGGIAPGIDRFVMAALGEPNVREVMAFPTSSSGQTSVMNAPSEPEASQLAELGIALEKDTLKSGDDVYAAIVRNLEETKIAYKAYEHEIVHTSEDAAKVRGTDLSEGAKAILLYADKRPVMAVVGGDKRIDFKTFKKIVGVKDLRMATPEEVEDVTSVPIGAVPPFGHIFNIPLYMDKDIETRDHVVFNAGLHTKSIRMKTKDFVSIARPTVETYSK